MIITPEEFLQKTKRLGISHCFFKAAMVDITRNVEQLHQTINGGKDFYFSYGQIDGYIQFFASTDTEANEREDEIVTHAFRLLKIIAE